MIVATINKKLLVHFDTKRLFKAQKSSKQVSIWSLRDDIMVMCEEERVWREYEVLVSCNN